MKPEPSPRATAPDTGHLLFPEDFSAPSTEDLDAQSSVTDLDASWDPQMPTSGEQVCRPVRVRVLKLLLRSSLR